MSTKTLKTLAHETIVSFITSETGLTQLMRTCKSESDVIFSVQAMLDDIEPTLKARESLHLSAVVTKKVTNGLTQFIARCRNGSDKLPPVWFDKSKTLSFDPVSFVPVKPRNTKSKADAEAEKAKAEADINAMAEAKAEALLADKATLTKAQTKKIESIEKASEEKVKQAQELAKQTQSANKDLQTISAKQAESLRELQSKYNELDQAYSLALRQIDALTKALKLAKVEASAIEALIKHA